MINIRITERDYRKLREQAKEQGMKLSDYAASLVRQALPMVITIWQSEPSNTWEFQSVYDKEETT